MEEKDVPLLTHIKSEPAPAPPASGQPEPESAQLRRRKSGSEREKREAGSEPARPSAKPMVEPRAEQAAAAPAAAKRPRPAKPRISYYISSWLFLRAVGLLYLIAFLSSWVQIHGLIGETGISPVADYMARVRNAVTFNTSFLTHPTIFWIAQSDAFIHAVCAAGALASLMLILDMIPALSIFVAWSLYLSISTGGQSFFSHQWDYLLLETGFLSLFLSSFHTNLRPWKENPRDFHPPDAVLWLFRLLLFRLNFARGLSQLLGRDKTWRTLSAFSFHFETQPSPTALSWYAHQLPGLFHQGLVFWVLTVEIGIVFLIVGPQLFRRTAALYIVLLQFFYILTGNYGTFHWNVIALCLLLLDDGLFPGTFKTLCRVRKTKVKKLLDERASQSPSPHSTDTVPPSRRRPPAKLKPLHSSQARIWHRRVAIVLAVFVIVMTTVPLSMTEVSVTTPQVLLDIYTNIYPFKMVNHYAPFNRIQKERFELIIQGSVDAQNWFEYQFLYKPDGNIWKMPMFVSPHISRLEYQLWNAAQSDYNQEVWMSRLLHRLLEDSSSVLALFKKEPFGEVPEFIRAVRYKYSFTNMQTSKTLDGAWWMAEFFDIFTPSFSQSIHSMSDRRKSLRARVNQARAMN